MNIWLFGAGLLCVGVAFFDALWTTLWPEGGAGPLSSNVSRAAWAVAKRLTSSNGHAVHARLSAAGPVIVVVTVLTWVILLIGGLVLIFYSEPQAVVDADIETAANTTERIWFTLYTVSTMGNGEFKPGTGLFQVISGLASLSAISLLSLVVTYVVQLLSAVVHKRTFAAEVFSFGNSAIDITDSLRKSRPEGVATQLAAVSTLISSMRQQHKAYPILHYFHPKYRHHSATCAIASLDEALTVYLEGLPEDSLELVASTLQPLRNTIGSYLEDLQGDYLVRAEQVPPTPAAEELASRGIEIARPEALEEQTAEREQRRRLLMGLVDYNGWSWDDVLHGAGPPTGAEAS
ncbi:MAG: ion channel [Persicimonas sp.]